MLKRRGAVQLFVFFEGRNDRLCVSSNRAIRAQQVVVQVAEMSAAWFDLVTVGQVEEERAAADKRFEVLSKLARNEFPEVRNSLALPPGPFQEWSDRSSVGDGACSVCRGSWHDGRVILSRLIMVGASIT